MSAGLLPDSDTPVESQKVTLTLPCSTAAGVHASGIPEGDIDTTMLDCGPERCRARNHAGQAISAFQRAMVTSFGSVGSSSSSRWPKRPHFRGTPVAKSGS